MKWLEASNRCPLCCALLVTPEEFREEACKILGADWVQDIANFVSGFFRRLMVENLVLWIKRGLELLGKFQVFVSDH
jgi:hypothetical protein